MTTTSDTPGSATQQPDDTNVPQFSSGTQNAIGGMLSKLNPFSGSIGNYTMVAVGVVLMLGALLISQKETVVQVAATAAKVAA